MHAKIKKRAHDQAKSAKNSSQVSGEFSGVIIEGAKRANLGLRKTNLRFADNATLVAMSVIVRKLPLLLHKSTVSRNRCFT